MSDGKIVDENCIKMQQPTEGLLIGYTGIKEVCEGIIKESIAISSDLRKLDLLADNMKKYCISLPSNTKAFFILAGMNSDGNNQLISISNKGIDKNLTATIDGIMHTAHSGSERLDSYKQLYEQAYQKFNQDLKSCRVPEDIISAQTTFNDAIAQFDISVNKEHAGRFIVTRR
ncbi:hypothetical protein ACSYR0_00460 (plasmid) [Bacillus cereus]|uniref:hypothetical protein n=1 Tax=Bacillus cereus TaxID=1396 RepID=UPI0001A0E53D|nr:hypothetical protein [Bacillus cereus]EEL64424.1 hypothetical protein bcere0025_27650 [Bacillus cereus F65185]